MARLFMGLGRIGLVARSGGPFTFIVGWFARRMGWIGWASAPLAGFVGACALGVMTLVLEGDTLLAEEATIISLFLPYSAAFAILGWLALRLLRPDVCMGECG